MPDRYVYPGIMPFLTGLDKLRPELASRIGSDFYVAQVSNALAQISDLPVEHREAAMQHALDAREALAASLAVVDRAIAEVRTACIEPPKAQEAPAKDAKPA